MVEEISFDKYAIRGAYHWTEYFGPIHRINASTRARYRGILTALQDHNFQRGGTLLDVGCGDAALTGLLVQQLGAKASGIDTTSLSIDLARREFSDRGLQGDFSLIDGYSYPFKDASFAAVVCSDVIEHVREPEAMLKEMWRVLAPGGVLVVTTPVRYTEQPLDRFHVQEWFPQQFQDFCSQALKANVELRLSHPVALCELYASGSPVMGRASRLIMNSLSKAGFEPFGHRKGFRAFGTQTAIVRKQAVSA